MRAVFMCVMSLYLGPAAVWALWDGWDWVGLGRSLVVVYCVYGIYCTSWSIIIECAWVWLGPASSIRKLLSNVVMSLGLIHGQFLTRTPGQPHLFVGIEQPTYECHKSELSALPADMGSNMGVTRPARVPVGGVPVQWAC
jgi:hypothetical protein